MKGAVRVMQCDDRDASELLRLIVSGMRWGDDDQPIFNKARVAEFLAHHREAETERCANVAETLDLIGDGYFDDDATIERNRRLAQSIRSKPGDVL